VPEDSSSEESDSSETESSVTSTSSEGSFVYESELEEPKPQLLSLTFCSNATMRLLNVCRRADDRADEDGR
jgi:hypothetical protein